MLKVYCCNVNLWQYAFFVSHKGDVDTMQAYEKLKKYINFKDKKEFNEHLTAYLQEYCYQLNETDKKLLTYLSRYAIRYLGAAYLKVKTMAKLIGKSDSTVKRSISKLETLGIIKRFNNKREVLGGFGANTIQFQRYDFQNDLSEMTYRHDENNVENACESKVEKEVVETKPFISSKQNNLKDNTYYHTLVENAKKVSKDFKNMSLYERIKYLLNSTIGDDSDLKEYCKVVYGNIKSLLKFDSFKPYKVEIEALAYESVKTTIYAQNIRTTRPAFLHGVINKKIMQFKDQIVEFDYEHDDKVVFVQGQIPYNWLEN